MNLNGWVLGGGTSSVGTFVAFDSGVSMAPGAHLLVGDEFVAGADLFASISLGNASSNADIVQLSDCAGVVADTLVYGAPNTDGWVDDGGMVATSLAPKPGTDHSLARISDGYDTDACAADFVVVATPTPGGTNWIESDADVGLADEEDSGDADGERKMLRIPQRRWTWIRAQPAIRIPVVMRTPAEGFRVFTER